MRFLGIFLRWGQALFVRYGIVATISDVREIGTITGSREIGTITAAAREIGTIS
jgi:hypothetical protein